MSNSYFETTAKAAKHTYSLDHIEAYNHIYTLLQQKITAITSLRYNSI